MRQRFDDKVALVTGGGRGIGEATCRRLALEGAAVGVCDFDVDVAEAVATQIRDAGGHAVAVQCDVRQETSAKEAVEVVVAQFGGLDVLVNNAGIQRHGTVETTTMQDWDDVIATNLKGPFLMARHAVPHMRRRGGGAIVNTASVQAFASLKSVVAYTASKGGVVAMTRTMALDHAPDRIRVNAVAPGSVRTPMLELGAEQTRPHAPESIIAEWGRAHPLGTVIDPADIASIIAFLASDDAQAITGTTYVADAGLSAGIEL